MFMFVKRYFYKATLLSKFMLMCDNTSGFLKRGRIYMQARTVNAVKHVNSAKRLISSEEQIFSLTTSSITKSPGEAEEGGQPKFVIEEPQREKRLTFEEASRCLSILGKDETGMRYAYIMITATDRQLTDVSVILCFKHVLFVDVSNNYLNLEALRNLVQMPFLIYLKAEMNRLDSAALKTMHYLQMLKLNRNHILDTVGICQPVLNHLELSYNQIYTAEFEDSELPELKHLEMRGNFLPNVGGSFPVTIEAMYLAENRISRVLVSAVWKLANLHTLHLRDNQIRKLDGFTDTLVNLKYLNLRKNNIGKFRQFKKLQCLPVLETLIVLQNPIAGEQPDKGEEEVAEEEEEDEEKLDPTRIPILVLLPNLKRINKETVTAEERDEAAEVRDEKLEEIMAEDSSDDEETTPDVTDNMDTD